MDKKDEELRDLLEPLRSVEPTPAQLQQWQKAVAKETATSTPSKGWVHRHQWAAMLAAASIGFVLGWLVFRQPPALKDTANFAHENVSDDATIVYITANSLAGD